MTPSASLRGRWSFALLTAIWTATGIASCGGSADAPAASSEAAALSDPSTSASAPGLGSDDFCNAAQLSTVLTPVPPPRGGGTTPINVTVHYHRPDGQYAGWGLHLWQINDAGQFIADYPGVTFPQPLLPSGLDDYGAVFQVEAARFTAAGAAGFGLIVHQGDTKDPDGDRFWRFSGGGEIWLLSGDATIFTTNPLGAAPDLATVRVHYQRFDGNYAQWGLHLWATSGLDISRLPGLHIDDFANPVPLSAAPGFAAQPDGSVVFDLPVLGPRGDPSRTALEFIIHGMPDNPAGGVNNKDGWSSNIHVNYQALDATGGVGEIWLVQDIAQVFTAVPNTRTASTSDARAVWLTRGLLRWPHTDTAGSFKLYHSATGQIVAAQGAPVTGADGALALSISSDPLPPAIAQRFAYVGAGPTLAVVAPAALDAVLTSQLVVVQEDAAGNVLGATTAQLAGLLDDRFAAAARISDLGATASPGRDAFKLWAPTAQRVALCLYSAAAPRIATAHVAMTRDPATGAWSAALRGGHAGSYYRFAVEVFVRGVGVVRNLVTDPYSVSLDANSRHSYLADLDAAQLKPAGWDHHRSPDTVAAQEDMTIYELHVRDFSASDATVPTAHRGKFLAFTDRNTNGMRHLRELARAGITDVHLLPSFDLATVPELGCVSPAIPIAPPDSEAQQAAVAALRDQDCFNWGYDPFHYTAPEGAFSTQPDDGASRIREMRAAVMALHDAGLRVGMDVVYNHTTASGQSDRSVLDRVVPGYYHRLDATGSVTRSSCCDDTAAENLMMGKLVVDSVATWASQYHIDSFRFDLMSFLPRPILEQVKARTRAATGREIQLLGEGWNFGEVANGARFVQASQLSLNGSGIATFSDRARDFIRGGGPFDSGQTLVQAQGFVNGLFYDDNGSGGSKTRGDLMHAGDIVKVGLAGSIRDYPLVTSDDRTVQLQQIDYFGQPAGYVTDPQEVVNYFENHDNQTMFDIGVYKLPLASTGEDRVRSQMLAVALDAFSQGIAYFHAGVETLRSKSMDQNSFNSGDWFNRLDWTFTDNGFGAGAPLASDNAGNWPIIKPLLANPAIKPSPAAIGLARDMFRDLLAIRASSPLFHLRTAADIKRRLVFYNTGSAQEPTVIVGHLDGRGVPRASDDLIYLVNVDRVAHTIAIPAEKRKPYHLHPVQARFDAADHRPATSARYDRQTGAFTVPPRTTVVFVAGDRDDDRDRGY